MEEKSNNINEVDYPISLIKSITPYLDDVKYTVNNRMKGDYQRNVSNKHRAFAWYYVYNGGNKTDAFRRSNYCTFDKESGKLLPCKDLSYNTLAAGGARSYKMPQIQECIRLIRAENSKKIKSDIPQTILEQLQIQATYDPSMFIKPDGAPKFKDWDEIPPQYRCCVENIESRYHGKDADVKTTKITLVNREKARKELMALAPDLLVPNKIELLHKTLDSEGKETGIGIFKNMTDDDLRAIIAQNKEN